MHLKSLTLKGFKSFASSTTLNFEPGITAVVGPNGSGKSNVVDALSWVMGEQGAKNLRGSQMADVIFAGAGTRPALGRAQVSLTIDNTDGTLPIDYSEVTITRTMFRTGGSEYEINGAPARLLDVQELLSDTGMGKQMHVIVGQGQLDTILNATPEQRRALIDEAAGVLKHRRRKERALSKLASLDSKTARLQDLRDELKRQLSPLARQAQAASKAAQINAQIRELKGQILGTQWRAIKTQLHDQNRALNHREEHRLDLIRQRDELKAQLEAKQDEGAFQSQFANSVAVCDSYTALIQRASTMQQIAVERAAHLRPKAASMGPDPQSLKKQAEEIRGQAEEVQQTADQKRSDLSELTVSRARLEAEQSQAANTLTQQSNQRSNQVAELARVQGRIESAKEQLAALAERKKNLQATLEEAEQHHREASRKLADFKTPALDSQGAALAQREQAETAVQKSRQAVDQLLQEEREVSGELVQARSRLSALEQILDSHLTQETFNEGLFTEDGLGYLVQNLEVPDLWTSAISFLLGTELQGIVFASAQDAHQKLTEVYPIDSLLSGETDSQGAFEVLYPPNRKQKTPKAPKHTQWAHDLIKTSKLPADLVANLLSGVLLYTAEESLSLTEIQEIFEAAPSAKKILFPSGLLCTPYSVSRPGTRETNLLELESEQNKIKAKIEELSQLHQKVQAELSQARTTLDNNLKASNQALKLLREADAAAAQAVVERSTLETEERVAAEEVRRTQARQERIEQERAELEKSFEQAQNSLDALPTPLGVEEVERCKQQLTSITTRVSETRDQESQLSAQIADLEAQVRRLQTQAQALESAAKQETDRRQRAAESEARRKKAAQQVELVIDMANSCLRLARRGHQLASQARAEISAKQQESEKSRSLLTKQLEQVRSDLEALNEDRQNERVQIAQLQVHLENLETQIAQELGMSASEIQAQYPEDPEFQLAEATEELALNQRRLERLGKVNPLALEELNAAQSRFDYLNSQLSDITDSRKDLLSLIDEVDEHVQKVFESAYEDTAKAFSGVFSTLFPGGHGELRLTDPEDLLGTGVEIAARPAGKKISRLSLLSGGERSLAAIALLVSIFIARPSPFYVMDEVEAALDDTNLTRLLRIFRQLKEKSQLIIITHQKRTMEVADALYGITMREGVTKVLSSTL
ncbi:chromosome segregation protein SMC [Boudabousia liubingyangii]|uniref:chromosome segregation protein SMC n=1 Tax=Boudabousia liubingyangii TaxID=1921764 RepID=UPI00093B8526|nr:chromosome segregation protein SMC [Boudabousia liubingyangii]OKL46469.1 chromosome segregation protein SMC [Boudabousia liubingyangii]